MCKPIIGIVTKHFKKDCIRPNMYIRDEVKQAVFDNGAIAIGILLPIDEKKDVQDKWENNLSQDAYDSLIAQVKLCDGIILQGGDACDNYEMIIAKYCYDNDIPVLGICHGQHVLVRALGGTTKRLDNRNHQKKDAKYVHSIKIDKDSKFYQMINKDNIMVNSRHVRITNTCPKLNIVAFSSENYPEAIESADKQFYLAVQFHPESLYKTDENMNNIFKCFINVCKK